MIARIQLGRLVSGIHLDLMRAPLEGSQVRSFGFLSRSIPRLSEAQGHIEPLTGRCSSAKEPVLISILGLLDIATKKDRAENLAVVKETIQKLVCVKKAILVCGGKEDCNKTVLVHYRKFLDPIDFIGLTGELFNRGIKIIGDKQRTCGLAGEMRYMFQIELSQEMIEVLAPGCDTIGELLMDPYFNDIWKEGLSIESYRLARDQHLEKLYLQTCQNIVETMVQNPNDFDHKIQVSHSSKRLIGDRLIATLEKEGFEPRIEDRGGYSILHCKNPS